MVRPRFCLAKGCAPDEAYTRAGASKDLISNAVQGKLTTRISMKRKVSSPSFFEAHPVFSLRQAARALGQPAERERVRGRLKHHLKTGRLKTAARGAYVVVPYGRDPKQVKPDPFLVAATLKPDAVFSHHSALELLGVAQSLWRQCTLYTSSVRRPLKLADHTVLFLAHPTPLRGRRHELATQQVERAGVVLRVTGPERTLVEGFRRPVSGALPVNVPRAGERLDSVRTPSPPLATVPGARHAWRRARVALECDPA